MRKRDMHIVAVAGALMLALSGQAAAASTVDAPGETRACTWGGTPAATTGTITIKPGLTLSPSDGPLKFVATGDVSGEGCKGTVTFTGIIRAGGTCANQMFEGRVKGLPGVARFEGPGIGGMVHEFLYDADGNIVGADQPQVLSGATMGGSAVSDCNTDKGFTNGHFSSIIELWG